MSAAAYAIPIDSTRRARSTSPRSVVVTGPRHRRLPRSGPSRRGVVEQRSSLRHIARRLESRARSRWIRADPASAPAARCRVPGDGGGEVAGLPGTADGRTRARAAGRRRPMVMPSRARRTTSPSGGRYAECRGATAIASPLSAGARLRERRRAPPPAGRRPRPDRTARRPGGRSRPGRRLCRGAAHRGGRPSSPRMHPPPR
jgi:hypothetical protein